MGSAPVCEPFDLTPLIAAAHLDYGGPCRCVPTAAWPQEILQSIADPSYHVQRVHFSELSVGAFRRRASSCRNPLVVTGLGPHLAPYGLTAAVLRAVIPVDLVVPVRGQPARRAADFFEALQQDEPLYLADAPIAHHFPWLYQLIKVPRYFRHCFCHRTRQNLSIAYDTPALFVGGAGTLSSLHVDQMCSNFWMYLGEGAKHWTCFHPDDAPLLSPMFDEPEQIDRFAPLAQTAVPSHARRIEFVLQAGELLYIPWGTPHEVLNLTATTAVSANYLDQTNIDATVAQGRAKLDHRAAGSSRHDNLRATLDALDEIEWPCLDDDVDEAEQASLPGEAMATSFPAHERLQRSKPVKLG